jgi:hypothetical protein
MPIIPQHYFSIFFILGLLVVMVYALQRFNEPSFPNRESLPRVAPLRYFFLRRAYRRALFTYVTVSLLLYCLLVLPGPSIVPALGIVGVKDFPVEGWALLVALFLVGLLPNSSLKWLNVIEEWLRRLVHAWFFVPDGIVRTIGVLEDARYEPPASQLEALAAPTRKKLRNDLRLPTGSLRYRWARATMLIASLRQMGAGAAHPLSKAAFEPFQEDFEEIVEKHRLLAKDIEALGDGPASNEAEQNLTRSVDKLLRRIYAYISWGIRHQADSEQDVDQTLEALGFQIPPTVGHRLFDIVMPAVLLVAVMTMLFWLTDDAIRRAIGARAPSIQMSVLYALTSAVAASLMYGGAVFIALKRRATQIEQKAWRQASPRCLVPIAIHAGLVTWMTIIASTALWQLPDTLRSLVGLVHMAKSFAIGQAVEESSAAVARFFPVRMLTALPWLLAGSTVSVLLANLMSGDVRQTGKPRRALDAVILGSGLGLAAALAQVIQTSVSIVLNVETAPFDQVPIVALAGFACGAVIGAVVPQAGRSHVTMPFDPLLARALRDLLRQAETTLGSRAAAESWVFMPHNELGGIAPAEAVQYKTQATGVRRLLESEAPRQREETRPDRSERPVPTIVEGGRSLDAHVA